MKKVLRSNSEVAHVWASASQSEGRSGSMFFEGDTIYSYGRHFPIARHLSGVVLFTTHDYSVTTAKHKSVTRGAVSHLKVYYVDDVNGNHEGNTRGYIATAEKTLGKIKRSRSSIQRRLDNLRGLVNEMRDYAAKFARELTPEIKREVSQWVKCSEQGFLDKATKEKLLSTALKVELAHKHRREMQRAAYAARYAAIEARRKMETETMNVWGSEIDALALAAWERGEQLPRDPYVNEQEATRLRLTGNEIETSRGAYVPLNEALMLWGRMQAGQSIAGLRVGPYEVTGVHDGKLVVGCHRIPLRELARMANKLGLGVNA